MEILLDITYGIIAITIVMLIIRKIENDLKKDNKWKYQQELFYRYYC